MTSKPRAPKPVVEAAPPSSPVEQINEMLQKQNLQLSRELKTFRARTQKLTDEVTNLEFEKVVFEERIEQLELELKAVQATAPQAEGPQPISKSVSLPVAGAENQE